MMRKLLIGLLGALLTSAVWAQVPSSQTSVTCATTSGPFLFVANTLQFLTIQIPVGGNTTCFNFVGQAATTSPPSMCYAAGTYTWYNIGGSQLVPGGLQINCIANTASQAVAVMYR